MKFHLLVTVEVDSTAPASAGTLRHMVEEILNGRIIWAQSHPPVTVAIIEGWPACAVCGAQSNFCMNGVAQTLCFEHHPLGRRETERAERERAGVQ